MSYFDLKKKVRETPLQGFWVCFCLSFFVAIFSECFYEAVGVAQGGSSFGFLGSDYLGWHTVRAAVVFLLSFAVCCLLFRFGKKLLTFCDHFRYPLAVLVLIICVIFEISGSSIAVWAQHLGTSMDTNTLFGIPRSIRSDEWQVFTPFAFSQEFNSYSPLSSILRGTPTDLTLVYAQPCWDISTLFRPFLCGYLLLGSAKGLSFFWCARLLAMFLASYEGAKVLFCNNKAFAAVFALIAVFSPITQWWFATNGMAELFIFGFGMMLSVYGIFRNSAVLIKCLCSVALAWCAGCYIMILYPAWQIPLFYVFAFFTVIAVSKALKQHKLDKTDSSVIVSVLLCIMALVVIAVVVGLSLLSSIDVYEVISDTVYPGNRLNTGGGSLPAFLSASITIFSSLDADSFVPNVCDAACTFSLAPIGIVLSIIALLYSRKADWILIVGLIIEVFFACYAFFGFPEILAQLTLFSRTTAVRLVFILGIIDAFLLLYSLMQIRDAFVRSKALRLPTALIVLLMIAGFAAIVLPLLGEQPYRLLWSIMLAFVVAAVVVSTVRYIRNGTCDALLLSFAVVLVVSGCTVNPVQQGADVLSDNEVATSVREIVKEDPDAIWIADNAILGQACVAAGGHTINCVNIYPNLPLWSNIFPDGSEADVYNRYAHINIWFSKYSPSSLGYVRVDYFNAYLDREALKKTEAKYYISCMDMEAESGNGIQFTQIGKPNDTVALYRITYNTFDQ